jgi:outer membrane receptor protein involved in Fe transport
MTNGVLGLNRNLVMAIFLLQVGALATQGASAADATTSGANPSTEADSGALQEVLVTARRQSESVLKVPESITVMDSATLTNLGVNTFGDFATKVPNMSFQYGGSGGGNGASLGFGGSRAIAIRGVSGVGTTGFYIDDTPIPPTIDPQVLDLDHVEVLKGPQGTLYGEGSMGGNVRLVTKAPTFTPELKVLATAGHTTNAGSPDGRTEIIGNVPLIDDVAAMRVAAYVSHEGGFITRQFPVGTAGALQSENNQGAVTNYGGSVDVLIKPTENLTITPRVIAQWTDGHGWPAAFAPLPSFSVQSLTSVRQADIQEGYTDKWYLPSVQINYHLPNWDLTSSTSYFHRSLYNLEDGTEGTIAATGGPPYNAPASVWAAGVPWPQFQTNSNVYQELRAAWAGNDWVHAILGGYYSNQSQYWQNGGPNFNFPGLVTTGVYPTPLFWDQTISSGLVDRSLFGEVYFKTHGFELTLGARAFWLTERFSNFYDGFLNGGTSGSPVEHNSEHGINPKASLSYSLSNNALVYASASKGFRPGGPNAPLPPACDPGLAELKLTADQIKLYKSDSLWNYEVGAKGRIQGFSVSGALFDMRWNKIQQSTAIPVCFIPATANAGAAEIKGAEFEVSGRVTEGLDLRLGLGYQSPRITQEGLTGQLVGSRILQVPYYTGSLVLTYTRPLTGKFEGIATGDYSYIGSSLSATNTNLFGLPAVERAGYGLLNFRLGTKWDNKQVSLFFKNITNSKANLGDVNPIAYPRTDPVTGQLDPRVVVQRPFQFGLEFLYNM